jgi:carnitine O-acetyltransferase
MASRKFTSPTSLDQKLAEMPKDNGAAEKTVERSEAAAVTETQSYSRQAREPLAASKSAQSKPGVTFAAQDKLPKLPIPDLESTLQKYLTALEPLQSGREHRATEDAVSEFMHNEGPQLNERLKLYATGKSSYIEQFCMQKTILSKGAITDETRVRLLPELRQSGRAQPQSFLLVRR